MRHNPNPPKLVSVSIRVTPETADRLRARAEANYRAVAAHVRALIEQDINEAREEPA